DPLPQLRFAVLDQLVGGKARQLLALARAHPLDDLPVEVDADVADVARADVVRPWVRRREMGQAARSAKDDSLVDGFPDYARERLSERIAARRRWRRRMHRIDEQRDHRNAGIAHEIQDRLGVR